MHPDSMPVQPDNYEEQIEWFATMVRQAQQTMNQAGIPDNPGNLPERVGWLVYRYKTLLEIAHECVGLDELMRMGYTVDAGNAELARIEKEVNAKGWSWED